MNRDDDSRTLLSRLLTASLSLGLVLAAGIASQCAAQTSTVGATLEGVVRDASGAVVAGAEVRLSNTATNQRRTVTADQEGFFRLREVPVGTYDLRVEQPGFAPYLHSGLSLSIGQTVQLEISLVPVSVSARVTVTAQPPPLDVSQTAATSTVDRESIEELPVMTRNSLDFVLLAPGVLTAPRATLAGQTLLATSGFTFGGLRARSNNISIDGLDNNDEYSGASRTELSPEIVHEFQVINNGVSAEYGGASGGSINVVTRSGANQRHGDAFIFAQNAALNSREPLESQTAKPALARYRVGLATGGPLIKDRTFYYAAAEQEYQHGQGDSDIDPLLAQTINRQLSGGALPRLGVRHVTAGFFPAARAETEASAKMDHQISGRHSLMLRYAFTNSRDASDPFDTEELTDASSKRSAFAEDHALVGSLTSVFSPRVVNDLRFQWAARRLTLRTNQQSGPGVEIGGLVEFGRPYDGNSRRRENHDEISDTLALSRGHHLLKGGGVINHVHLHSDAADGFGGLYIFPTLDDFLAGRADLFRQAFGDPATRFGVTSYGAFATDHWSVGHRLTADFGLRYDFEHLPRGFKEDTDNVSPRVGLAYSPTNRWVLRASYGLFYDRYVLANLNRAVVKDGVQGFEQVAYGATASSIFQQAGGGPLEAPLAGIAPSIFRADPHLLTSYSEQASLGSERQLTSNLTVKVNYLNVRGVKLSRTRNVNLAAPVILTPQNAAALGVPNPSPQQLGRNFFGPDRLNPRFDGIYLLEDSASSDYHGLSVSLNRRLADEVEFSASYTLSKTLDDASDFDEQPQNPYNLKDEWRFSRNQQAQRVVFSGLFELPFGEEPGESAARGALSPASSLPNSRLRKILAHVELAPIVTLGSGRPVNPLTGLDSNHCSAFPLSARPAGFGRNTLKTPALATVDFRVLKYFPLGDRAHLDLVAEFFNLLNHTNVSQISPIYGNALIPMPGFAQPTEAFNARQVQFSIDFEY